MNKLIAIQSELKAPKDLVNKFGGYRYRSAESILEALKPLLAKYECYLKLTDEVTEVGGRVYVKATATLVWDGGSESVTAYAREEENKKGMDGSQITGAASSYARKYALNGLFLIDDTKDSDATNTHGSDQVSEVTNEMKDELLNLLESSTYEEKQRKMLEIRINSFTSLDEFNKAKANLLQNQVGIDGVINPSQKDINRHVRNIAKQPA